MLCRLYHRGQEGELVGFELATDRSAQRFVGRVAYVLPGMGFGIRFVDPTEEQQLFLAVFMNS